MDKQSPEYTFLTFFDSVQMLGWKNLKQVHFYWQARKISSIFIFVGLFSNCLNILLPLLESESEQLMFALALILPLSAGIGFFFYIFLDFIFDHLGGRSIAKNHIAIVWYNSQHKLLKTIEDCDKNIISERDKDFLFCYPNHGDSLNILYKTWKKAIEREIHKTSRPDVFS